MDFLQLSHWGSWGSCKANNGKCGTGTRVRKRNVQVAPVCSTACGQLSETGQCMHSCCPVACVYNRWGAWSKCSNQCGEGKLLNELRPFPLTENLRTGPERKIFRKVEIRL